MTLHAPLDASKSVLTPAQTATVLGVHTNTVRSWADEYSAVLSESARSRPRLLTPSDVAVLQIVQQLRAENLPRGAVLERLRQMPTADLTQPYIDAAAPATQPTDSPTPPTVAPTALMDMSAVLVDIATLVDSRTTSTQEDVKRIDERLRKLEAQRLVWIGIAVGLVAGVALGVIVAVLLSRM